MQRYGSELPPRYNFTDIRVPVKVYWGTADRYFDQTDTEVFDGIMKQTPDYQSETRQGWSHMSFTYGVDSASIFEDIATDIKRYLPAA